MEIKDIREAAEERTMRREMERGGGKEGDDRVHEEAKNELNHTTVRPPPLPIRISLLVPLEGVLSIVPLIDLSVCVMEGSDDLEILCRILKVSMVASRPFPRISCVYVGYSV